MYTWKLSRYWASLDIAFLQIVQCNHRVFGKVKISVNIVGHQKLNYTDNLSNDKESLENNNVLGRLKFSERVPEFFNCVQTLNFIECNTVILEILVS